MIDILKILVALSWFFGGAALILLGAIAFPASPWLGGGICVIGVVLFLSFLAFAVD